MDNLKLLEISPQALFRYQAVCAVQVRLLAGMGLSQAVREVAGQRFPDWRNQVRSVSERSLYRWLDAYEREGLQGLEPQPRPRTAESLVLLPKLLDFLRTEKQADPEVSIPELLLRARLRGILPEDDPVSRVTVWRACRRMGLSLARVRKLADRDMRPFAYPHRMLMILTSPITGRQAPLWHRLGSPMYKGVLCGLPALTVSTASSPGNSFSYCSF